MQSDRLLLSRGNGSTRDRKADMNALAGFIVLTIYAVVLLMVVTIIVDFLPKGWTDKMVRKFAGKDLHPYEKDGDRIATCRRCNQHTLMSLSNPHLCTWCDSYDRYQDALDDEYERKSKARATQSFTQKRKRP